MKLKTFIATAVAFLFAGHLVGQIAYYPKRVVGNMYYDLTPIYEWLGKAQGAGSLARAESVANGWIGISDPLRGISGCLISYQVAQVVDGGIVVRRIDRTIYSPDADYGEPFFVTNYPSFSKLSDNEIIHFLALRNGTYRYTDTTGAARTIPFYDCGKPYVAPPQKPLTLEQIAAAKSKAAASKKSGAAAALKFNQDAAAKGDRFGLLRMGERYRDGDGVEKDLAKAKEYLQKAADAGSPTAKDELSKLNQP
ncbi:MAG TPA: hypothetical protein VFC17_11890 [Candidatus Limnocylindrales bacterium]|nr:hypothetical protein [Candidatus Limnocylindrales bacterium]